MNGDELLEFIEEISAASNLKIEEDLGGGFVRLNVAEAERRQAKHDIRSIEDVVVELIRNSRDSGCKNIFVSSNKDGNERSIVIIDDGCGIPSDLIELVFEPRVTSKLNLLIEDRYGIHGRGMALYSIKNNVKEIGILASSPGRGTFIKFYADTTLLTEKRDQSTSPLTKIKNGQIFVVKGPNNVLRILSEFALTHPDIRIFFGTPSQILATVYELSQNLLTQNKDLDGAFFESFAKGELPLWQCLGLIGDPKSLMEAAGSAYGLSVSLRNVHRIFAQEIEPLFDLRTMMVRGHKKSELKEGENLSLFVGRNLAKCIDQSDIEDIAVKLHESLDSILEKYFLRVLDLPKIRRENNQLKFTVDLTDADDE